MAQQVGVRIANTALIQLREDAGLSQHDLAHELNDLAAREHDKHPQIIRKTISRWERGEVVWPQPFYRRLLAEYFNVAVDELGFRRPRHHTPAPTSNPDELLTLVATPGSIDARVETDQHHWRHTRATLNQYRRELAVLAEALYPDHRVSGLEATGVITHPAWIVDQPVPLTDVALCLDNGAPEAAVSGEEPQSAPVRPLASTEQRYRRYHHAIRDLAPPRLFENRMCFRLLDVDHSHAFPRLRFGQMGFFDSVDTNEALAHETALHHLAATDQSEAPVGKASWRRLAFRKLIGDPFDLSRRALMGAVGTLTIRAGESPSVVLHQRHAGRVAGGGGMAHLLPAGIFQPSSVLPGAVDADFSLWRNIQREYAEELLGHDEYDGSGRPIRYDSLEPFVTMDRALADGRLRLWYLGVTLDALTLCGDILTVAVVEPDLYDELFADAVDDNTEGALPAHAIPFEAHTLQRLRELRQLSPGTAAALHLSWKHRATVLGRVGHVAAEQPRYDPARLGTREHLPATTRMDAEP